MDRPHEGLVRADLGGLKLRTEGDTPIMIGRFAALNEWTEINSITEGHFFERMAPGAFEKTIRESRTKMKVMYHHGLDPFFGTSVLGPIRSLETDTAYEVDLIDTDYNKRLVPMLESGLLGASFRFDIIKDPEVEERPVRSDWNPAGLPQVTLTEVRVKEFGPTPLPAYSGTSAGLRSVTDEFLLLRLKSDPDQMRVVAEAIRAAALETEQPEASTAKEPSRSTQDEPKTGEEAKPSWHLS